MKPDNTELAIALRHLAQSLEANQMRVEEFRRVAEQWPNFIDALRRDRAFITLAELRRDVKLGLIDGRIIARVLLRMQP